MTPIVSEFLCFIFLQYSFNKNPNQFSMKLANLNLIRKLQLFFTVNALYHCRLYPNNLNVC